MFYFLTNYPKIGNNLNGIREQCDIMSNANYVLL